jgi:UDP-N-acetylmuramate--L-alanine ligase
VRRAAEIATSFASKEALDGRRSFFLVGIGGAGMSALARMLAHRGFLVRGTDSARSPETDRLISEGIDVHIGHTGDPIAKDDVLIVTDAIELSSSPEVKRAREMCLTIVRRSQALGWLLRGHKVIAVTGTHGKTTTTGMIGAGLRAAGMDPLIVVGASVPDFGGPVVEGKGEWAVVEACEAYDSFHDIDPDIVVLTNLELDHVDFHGDFENLKDSVKRFARRLGEREGTLVCCADDAGSSQVANELVQEPDWAAKGVAFYSAKDFPDYNQPRVPELSLPGEHNRLNARGAIMASIKAGANPIKAAQGVAGFGGAERRLQVLQEGDITVIDDYAHHPSEIEASIQAVRSRASGKRLVVVYQPHLYSRTAGLIGEFASALSHADFVVLTDIYPAREEPVPGVSSSRIAEALTVPLLYVPNRHLLPRKVAAMARRGDVIVGMGAGNIAEFAPELIEEFKKNTPTDGLDTSGLLVAVAYGGDSAEREVSLHSGREVVAALKRKGYRAELIDFTELLLAKGDLGRLQGSKRPDLVFLAVHGTHAEDGAIQGLLELLHIPYTGSGIQSSALAMNKEITKTILNGHGLKVPHGVLLETRDQTCPMRPPVVVKPNAQGSTVGLSFVESQEELGAAIEKAFAYDKSVLVEEWVRGMEISVPVLGDRPLLPVEIAPNNGRYDFASKYLPGATMEIVPARLPDKTLKRSQEIALKAHQALGCEGATRTDMIVSEPYDSAEPIILEVNTLPGMTSTSLLPNSARAAGISFDDLVEWILTDALRRHGAKV